MVQNFVRIVAALLLSIGLSAGFAVSETDEETGLPQLIVDSDPGGPDSQYIRTDPLTVSYLRFDTDGDGMEDYRIVGDVDRDGLLEWDDVQLALDGLCDSDGDGIQDGRLADLDGDGRKNDPACGTLHVLNGVWVSRNTLTGDPAEQKDDQVYLGNYQGLTLRGNGIDLTIFETVYTAKDYLRCHKDDGGGGFRSRDSGGYLTLRDFTFKGLEPLECPEESETDDCRQFVQTAITITHDQAAGRPGIVLRDLEIERAGFSGVLLNNCRGLIVENVSINAFSGPGIDLSGATDAALTDITLTGKQPGTADAALVIHTGLDGDGLETDNLRLEKITISGCTGGVSLVSGNDAGIHRVFCRELNIGPGLRGEGHEEADDSGFRIREAGPGCVAEVTIQDSVIQKQAGHGLLTEWNESTDNRSLSLTNTTFSGNGRALTDETSCDIDINWDGAVVDGCTFSGGDSNADDIPEPAVLVKDSRAGTVIRDCRFQGFINPAIVDHAFLFASGTSNSTYVHNTFVLSDESVVGIRTGADIEESEDGVQPAAVETAEEIEAGTADLAMAGNEFQVGAGKTADILVLNGRDHLVLGNTSEGGYAIIRLAGIGGHTVKDNIAGGIDIRTDDCLVSGNLFSGGTKDGAALTIGGGNNHVYYSVIENSRQAGVHIEETAVENRLSNLTIAGSRTEGVRADASCRIENCIFWNNAGDDILVNNEMTVTGRANWFQDTDPVLPKGALYDDPDQTSFWAAADPGFKETAGAYYMLKADAACIDKGVSDPWAGVPGIEDRAGRFITDTTGGLTAQGGKVDLGAYEYFTDQTPPFVTGELYDPDATGQSLTWEWTGNEEATFRHVITRENEWLFSPLDSFSDTSRASIANVTANAGTWYLHVQARDRTGNIGPVQTDRAVVDSDFGEENNDTPDEEPVSPPTAASTSGVDEDTSCFLNTAWRGCR